MIKIVIWDQSRPISLYLKIQNSKFKNLQFVNCTFIIYKNGNKTNIQPILQSNSTSFMFNNIFCEININKVIHWGGGLGEWENRPNFFLEVKFQYLLVYPSTLVGYPSNIHTFIPSTGSWCVIMTFFVIPVI